MATAEHAESARETPRFPEFVAIVASMMALTALSIDMMLPALDQMRVDLAVDGDNHQQFVVTVYMLGFAVGQLFHGPLSDRFGRRPVLFTGLAIYAVASFAATGAASLDGMLAARFVQGLANAAPRIVAIAVVRDVYGGRRMAEVMSFVMMIFIMVPVLAPGLGSLVMVVADWRAMFGLLGVAALAVLIWTALRLPETRTLEMREPLSPAWLGRALRETVTTRQTLGYTLATGFVFGAPMAYVSSAQQIFTEVYPLGTWFPVLFGLVAFGIAVASLVNSRLVMRVGMRRLSHGAMIGFLAAGTALFLSTLAAGPPPLVLLLVLLAAAMFCFGLMMPNFNALAMEPMGRIAGTASSFVGAVTTGLAAGLSALVGQSFDGTVAPLACGYLAFGALAMAIVLITERGQLFGSGSAN